jgi:hypothetical protein
MAWVVARSPQKIKTSSVRPMFGVDLLVEKTDALLSSLDFDPVF